MSVHDLDRERIASLLRTQRYGRSLRVLALSDSTNDEAHADAAKGALDGHVIVADAQRKGRGSHGRVWSSPAGTDLYLSIVARPALEPRDLPPLTLAVGLGVADTVDALLAEPSRRARVKWPNDVWIDGKKCAGVLVEAKSLAESLLPVVIGVGLNVNRLDYPPELEDLATSVLKARRSCAPDGPPYDRAATLALLLGSIERRVDALVEHGARATAAEVDARLALKGARVRCEHASGTVLGLNERGELRLSTESGVVELLSGHVTPEDSD